MEEIKPIDRAIAPTKHKAWHYKIHPYFTKQSSNVVKAYILNYSQKGDTVLDSFSGSGVTAIESLSGGRKTIAVDIAPLSDFITRQTCIAPVNIQLFAEEFGRLETRMKETVEFVRKAKEREIENYKITDWYPKGIRLPTNADVPYVEDLFGQRELIVLSRLLKEIKRIEDPKTRNLMLFTFSGILHRASRTYSIDPAHKGGGDSGIFKVFRYWVPPSPSERVIWDLFRIRFGIVRRAKQASNDFIGKFFKEGDTFRSYIDSATRLSKFIKENSVDYIYTDPPYGAHIAYLDLSTMWDAWLGFKIPPQHKQLEVIEGGDIEHSKKDYLDLLGQSIVEMHKVLKKDGWMSLVFHHKEVNLWYAIRDAARIAGFEYVSTVAQPLSKQTFHKVKNPLRVLGESLIVNFRKSKSTYSTAQPQPLESLKVILNAAEREIVKTGGATLEEIMRAVVPELFEANLIDKVALKNTDDVIEILSKEFDLGVDERWHIRKENATKIGQYIPARERIRYYLISFLRREKKAGFNRIITKILPLLINGHEPTNKEIQDVLKEVAISRDGKNWELKEPSELVFQAEMEFPEGQALSRIPETTSHNQMIYRLCALGIKLGLQPYVGKREKGVTGTSVFKNLHCLDELPLKGLSDIQKKRIEQIDCIWFFKGEPFFAFEVEEHTSILSGLERFYSLLEIHSDIGRHRRLVIVAPKKRERKVTQELTESSFIGHPNFLEKKLAYVYYETLAKAFPSLISSPNIVVTDFERYLSYLKI